MNPSTSCPRFTFKIEFSKISGREWKHIFAGFKGDDDVLVEREAKQRSIRSTTCRCWVKRKETLLLILLDFAARQLRTISQPPAATYTHTHAPRPAECHHHYRKCQGQSMTASCVPAVILKSFTLGHGSACRLADEGRGATFPQQKKSWGFFFFSPLASFCSFTAKRNHATHLDGKLKCQD